MRIPDMALELARCDAAPYFAQASPSVESCRCLPERERLRISLNVAVSERSRDDMRWCRTFGVYCRTCAQAAKNIFTNTRVGKSYSRKRNLILNSALM